MSTTAALCAFFFFFSFDKQIETTQKIADFGLHRNWEVDISYSGEQQSGGCPCLSTLQNVRKNHMEQSLSHKCSHAPKALLICREHPWQSFQLEPCLHKTDM